MNGHALEAFDSFAPHPDDAWVFVDDAYRNFLRMQIVRFPTFMLPDMHKPTVICGLVHTFYGSGEIWMVRSDEFRRSAPRVLRQQRDLIAQLYAALKLNRLCMSIEAGRQDAALWACRLGFEYEATHKRAGIGGRDIEIYLWKEGEN